VACFGFVGLHERSDNVRRWCNVRLSGIPGCGMSKPIEDYGFIGNMLSGALVARDGSMDWLCLPRFDSDACFAALLGTQEHGFWRLCPANGEYELSRRYLPHTPILETTFETKDGKV